MCGYSQSLIVGLPQDDGHVIVQGCDEFIRTRRNDRTRI